MKNIIGILLLMTVFSCSQNKNKEQLKYSYYPNGKIQQQWTEVKGRKVGYVFNFYENGKLQSIFNIEGDKRNGEQLWFYENGALEKKIPLNSEVANGMGYYFYPSGNLQSDRYYKKDKQYLVGIDYWDRPYSVYKDIVHSNDSGHVFYKLNFDSSGQFIGTEGTKPSYVE